MDAHLNINIDINIFLIHKLQHKDTYNCRCELTLKTTLYQKFYFCLSLFGLNRFKENGATWWRSG